MSASRAALGRFPTTVAIGPGTPGRPHVVLAPTVIAVTGLLVAFAGCASSVDGAPAVSPAPAEAWKPPSVSAPAAQAPERAGTPALSPEQQRREKRALAKLTLGDAVNIALQNNPATRAAWADAKAAAASYGASKGAYYPTLDLQGNAGYSNTPGYTRTSSGGLAQLNQGIATYGPTLSLSYLLLDFGGRSSAVEQAKQGLIAADWSQNAVLQDTALQVEIAFFNHAGAKALLAANQSSLEDAKTNLAAAEARHRVGAATVADVLQAKTAFSQVQLGVQSAAGAVRTTKGALAVAMGYAANVSFELDEFTPKVPSSGLTKSIDQLITTAMSDRPDVQAARARALAAAAAVGQARSAMLPTLSAEANGGLAWVHDYGGPYNTYSGMLTLRVPLFAGFSRHYELEKAKANAEAAAERARGVEQQVIYQVFVDYSDFQTATDRARTTDDLVASAGQSEQVALGRYQKGVGSILDLLSAQRDLATARAEQINARLGWLTALAQLAHDVGSLGLDGKNPLTPTAPASEVKP